MVLECHVLTHVNLVTIRMKMFKDVRLILGLVSLSFVNLNHILKNLKNIFKLNYKIN